MDRQYLWEQLERLDYVEIDVLYGYVFNRISNNYIGYINNNGYISVGWRYNGHTVNTLLHHIIWWSATGISIEYPPYQINHLDGNKLNNSILNLELTDYIGNINHAFKLGLNSSMLISNGLKRYYTDNINKNRILSDDQVRQIRFLKQNNRISNRQIGRLLSVDKETIRRVINGVRYSEVI